MKNTKLENWDVQSSSLSVDGLQCHVTAALIPEQHSSIFQIATMRIEKQIVLPSNQWKITFMPGQAERVPITYLNQSIPSTLCRRIPMCIDPRTAICGDHSWMASLTTNDIAYRTLGV